MLWLRAVIRGVALFVQLLAFVMIVDFAVLWLLPPKNPVVKWLSRAMDPLLDPLRRFINKRLGGTVKGLLARLPIDVSPLVAVLLLQLIRSCLLWLSSWT
ncbi:YggT family protein [Clostridia bacterium]|nr:YggT family protein [Clostridia bacterium]